MARSEEARMVDSDAVPFGRRRGCYRLSCLILTNYSRLRQFTVAYALACPLFDLVDWFCDSEEGEGKNEEKVWIG